MAVARYRMAEKPKRLEGALSVSERRSEAGVSASSEQQRLNVVLCMVDDLGFSDLGCYGSEISTPNIDALGRSGYRFTQAYNSARCCPSRAALLTGLHPHQAGVGHMVWPGGTEAYQGFLNDSCVTIAEALRASGYQTFMSGKWHVGGNYDALAPRQWRPGDIGFPIPLQRGFDRFFGTLTGSGSYYDPATLMRQDRFVSQPDPDWYYTDAIGDEAVKMLETRDRLRPFFLYLAFTAPHWPLHARAETADRYVSTYRRGWDVSRGERYERLIEEGLIHDEWPLSPRDPDAWAWSDSASPEWEAYRMAVYAAQVEHLDAALGRVVHALTVDGVIDDTLVILLSDNGGCSELLREDVVPDGQWPSSVPLETFDGSPVLVGNRLGVVPGSVGTFASYDVCWANLSNTPFRRFKRWVHEGGVATPLIVRWPNGCREAGSLVTTPVHITDLMPTVLELTGAPYPTERAGKATPPLSGVSFASGLVQGVWPADRTLWFEHEGHRALRQADWKLVSVRSGSWELYNLGRDRTELVDLADSEERRVTRMAEAWFSQAASVGADATVFDDVEMIESNYVSLDPALRKRYWKTG